MIYLALGGEAPGAIISNAEMVHKEGIDNELDDSNEWELHECLRMPPLCKAAEVLSLSNLAS